MGKEKESLKERFSYGVSVGPEIVAVQERRFPSASGNADMPGEGDIMSCMSSLCRLCSQKAVVSLYSQYGKLSEPQKHTVL